MNQMTRAAIRNLAIKKSEANGLSAETANTLFNLAIQRLATEFRWDHLKKTYPDTLLSTPQVFNFIPGQLVYELPVDYLRLQSLDLQDASSYVPMEQLTMEQWDRLRGRAPATTTANGRPRYYIIDKRERPSVITPTKTVQAIVIDRYSDKTYPGIVRYYSMPTWLDATLQGEYDTALAPFPDFIMIEAVIFELYSFFNDDRENSQWQKLQYMVKSYLINQNDLDGKQDSIPLDRSKFSDNAGYNGIYYT